MKKLVFLFSAAPFLLFFIVSCSKGESDSADKQSGNPETLVKERYLLLAEQADPRIIIADVNTNTIVWEWKPEAPAIRSEHIRWFSNPSDAKLVYNEKYVLMTASGGAVALIRIADKKVMFYALAQSTGGNTHSAEILPDGNIVSASSTGSYLTLFHVDTLNFPDGVYKKSIPVANAHNVIWDQSRNLLWTASDNQLISFKYNNNCKTPDLTREKVFSLPGKNAHDLFPVYGEDALWLTTTNNVYKINLKTKAPVLFTTSYQKGIKSISSGPEGFPTIILKPKESWWTDEIIDSKGKRIFYKSGYKIYKSRWVLPNHFSYPENDNFKQCH